MKYFTVGPSQAYPKLKQYLREALSKDIVSLSHRSERYVEIHEATVKSLRKLLSIPKGFEIFFYASSLESMERILENAVFKHSFHVVTGAFSAKWAQFSALLGKSPTAVNFNAAPGESLTDLKIPTKTELICLTQNETSAGISLPMSEIRALVEKHKNKPLVALDIVLSHLL